MIEEYLQIVNTQDTWGYANLDLLAIQDPHRGTGESHPRERVVPLVQENATEPGELDPVPFYRQSLGLLSGYRRLAAMEDL